MKRFMKRWLPKIASRSLVVCVAMLLSACSTMPQGPERLARIDELVAAQEFARAEALLADLDARDPSFEALLVRRRAIRPLIIQFEENTVRKVEQLKASDQWPDAEKLLQDALSKLPDSMALTSAEKTFYSERRQRLEQIEREISLLRGEHLLRKASLVAQAGSVHPDGIKTRWQKFRYERETQALAEELAACGENAMAEARYDLAESCLKLAATLTSDAHTSTQLAILEQRRAAAEAESAARAAAERRAREEARIARKTEEIHELKTRYRNLMEAGWWGAAQEILAELREQIPADEDVLVWSDELKLVVDEQVNADIARGQALYSRGQLHEALAVWRGAAKLDPENSVLQAHIARVERFIAKLERLDDEV